MNGWMDGWMRVCIRACMRERQQQHRGAPIRPTIPPYKQPSPKETHPEGSEPWLGSVRPKHPISCPLASPGRYFCFCASLPKA